MRDVWQISNFRDENENGDEKGDPQTGLVLGVPKLRVTTVSVTVKKALWLL